MFLELVLKDCILVLKNDKENCFHVLTCFIKRSQSRSDGKKYTQSMINVQSCCFANLNVLPFCGTRFRRRRCVP